MDKSLAFKQYNTQFNHKISYCIENLSAICVLSGYYKPVKKAPSNAKFALYSGTHQPEPPNPHQHMPWSKDKLPKHMQPDFGGGLQPPAPPLNGNPRWPFPMVVDPDHRVIIPPPYEDPYSKRLSWLYKFT